MRRLFALLITITLFSCNQDSNSYKLTGTAEGFKDGTTITVHTIEAKQPKVIDTLTITNGKFEATYPKSEDIPVNFLRIDELNATVLFFPENEDLKVTLYKDSVQSSFVSGGNQNEIYRNFSKKLRDFNKQKQSNIERFKQAQTEQDNAMVQQIQQENLQLMNQETAYRKAFIKENNNSVFAVMLLSEMFSRKTLTAAEAKAALDNLTPKMAAMPITEEIRTAVENMSKSDIGGMAPDFSAPTPTGEQLSLKDALGKYTIIDFWASWCKPCRRENPNVVSVYNKYHDKGLNIISVSLDRQGQKAQWVKAIEDDKMDWYHVSNLQFWQDPIARMYNVRSIPATFLLDEEGRIIDKNLLGAALHTKIASLLD